MSLLIVLLVHVTPVDHVALQDPLGILDSLLPALSTSVLA